MNDVDPQAWQADVLTRLSRSPREPSRRPASLELEGEQTIQGRRCCLWSPQTIAPARGAGRIRTICDSERQKKRETESVMYKRKELLAYSTLGRLLADRDQSIASAIKRMMRIYDFFGGGYVIVNVVGISRCPRSRALNDACRNTHGGRRPLADRWDLDRSHDRPFGQQRRIAIRSSAMGADDSSIPWGSCPSSA